MTYSFYPEHRKSLLKVLNELRWCFDKNTEYPDFTVYGVYHPNLLIETAIDEIMTEEDWEDLRREREAAQR